MLDRCKSIQIFAYMHAGTPSLIASLCARRWTAPGLIQDKFAERSGHGWTFAGAVGRGQMNVSVTGLDRIAEALGCQLVDLVAVADIDVTGSVRR